MNNPALLILQEFDRVFHNLRGRLTLLPLHDSFVDELVSAGILNNNHRYQIFSSPCPTIYSNIRRALSLIQILWDFQSVQKYIQFCEFLRQVTSLGRSQADYFAIRDFVLYLDTEFSNSAIFSSDS